MIKENFHLVHLESLGRVFQLVDQVFPFHLIINRKLQIVQLGRNLKKIDKTCEVGHLVSDFFEIVKPIVECSFENFSHNEGEVFLLSLTNKEISFKGEVVVYEDEGIIIFLGAPVISDGELFRKYNLTLSDFAAYDASPEYLVSIRAQENSYREIKNLVKELKNSKIKLLQSNLALKQFAYIASHDLQSPLRTVVSFAQLLGKRYGESFDEIGKEYLNFIISGTKKMQLLINDLLEYTRVQQVKEKFEIVDINEVIQQLMLDLQYDIQQQNATIEFSNLPSIYANLRLIKQLFQNLISNAIKFCQIETPIIQIHFEEKGDVWQFSVKDNGIGFKMDEGKRIFEIFQRAVGQGAYQGTGIGLAICKRVVEKHEGKIWVESERLVGSTFYCTISKYLSTKF